MLKKLTGKILPNKKKSLPVTTPAQQLGINKLHIHPTAIKVIETLENGGYEAYVVGGAIRDLLLGHKPKDFDVATNATPEQIRHLFKNSRIIGRRFRLVHIHFGRNIIEVATFRGDHTKQNKKTSAEKTGASLISDSGQLLRDNVYGTMEEDALRRDFSLNALYYSISKELIYDYTDGLNDIHKGYVRIIGLAEQRYKEDPVRMLRAIRFSTTFNLKLEAETQAAIKKCNRYILEVSNARLYDEMVKLLHNIHAVPIMDAMQTQGLFQRIFPFYEENLYHYPWYKAFFREALENTVARIKQEKPVTIAYLYAVLLWPELITRTQLTSGARISPPVLHEEIMRILRKQSVITSIPKQHMFIIKDIWEFQLRLAQRHPKKAQWLVQQKRFRAAFDFLLLREASGEIKAEQGAWWEKFQFASEAEQHAILKALKPNVSAKQKSGKQRRKNHGRNQAPKQQN